MRGRVKDLLDDWCNDREGQCHELPAFSTRTRRRRPALLRDPLDPGLRHAARMPRKFRAQRSLRDVEPTVPIWVKRPRRHRVPEEEE